MAFPTRSAKGTLEVCGFKEFIGSWERRGPYYGGYKRDSFGTGSRRGEYGLRLGEEIS